jgi:hypothetical protein
MSCVKKTWLRAVLVAVPLVFGLGCTVRDYFGEFAQAPTAAYWFEQGAVTLAGRVNDVLGEGWNGERMLHGTGDEGQVFLDTRLWSDWPQVRFLTADVQAVTLRLEGAIGERPVAVFAWPYDDWKRSWTLLPAPAEIVVERGPLSQGDVDPEPYLTYLAFYGAPVHLEVPAEARFSGGVEFLGASVVAHEGNVVRIRIRWRTTTSLTEDYTIFLHYLRDGERIAQADSGAAYGYYPTSQWRVGDVVNDDHDVILPGDPAPGRDRLRFGFWNPETGGVLELLDESGNPVADWMEVDVE